MSQSRLAQLSGVSRFKICMFELGHQPLTAAEHNQLEAALKREAQRLVGSLTELAAVSATS
jgi:hypothetical protein